MRLALLTTDNRQPLKDYSNPVPYFGTAPEALLQGLAQLPDLEVHVLSCTRQPMISPERLGQNVWFHSLQVPKIGWMRTGYLGCIRAARKKLKAIQPDIVHGQGTELDCAMNAVFSSFPNVVTIHGNMADMARVLRARIGSFGWCAARLENFALRRTAGVFCNSRFTQELVRPRTPQTWLVPNALRQSFFDQPRQSPRGNRCILLHVGVICQNKQQLKMLELARLLHRQKLNFEVQFLGGVHSSNEYARVFLEQLREAEREGYARHLKPNSVDELISCFDRASVLVHTPLAEAFGLVVAEALARDLKFFGFQVGGVADIVEGIEDAVLVPAGNWAELGNAIGSWLQAGHPSARPSAHQMRARYHPLHIARRHTEIYREVLSRAS